MSTYHCSVKIVSRSSGRSSVGAAAYRAGEKLTNERDGITHDYTRKGGVVYSEIMLPENAPAAYSERAYLWNEVERSESRINSQTAREIEVALPRELNPQEQAAMLREYIKDNFVSQGMCADFSIHNKDKGNNNPHAHILLTTRNITPEGFTSKNRDWNQKQNVEAWRESWAQLYNREMEKKSLPARVDHRSYARQGIDREPTIHRGPAAHHMERRGRRTDRGDINRGIEARNRAYTLHISELREDVTAYTADGVSLFPYGREQLAMFGLDFPLVEDQTVIHYVEPKERDTEAGGRPSLYPVTLDKGLVLSGEDSRASYWTILPMSQDERVWLDYSHAGWDESGQTLTASLEADKSYMVYDWMGFESREISGAELSRYYQGESKEQGKAAPEREEGRTEGRREPERNRDHTERKTRVRGSLAAVAGVSLPLGARAALEMRRCQQIDNIQAMARALRTIRRENVRSYSDFDRNIEGCRAEIAELNKRIEPLTREYEGIAESIGPLKIYEDHLPYRQEIERAGIFQKKKLEQSYRLKLQALEGSEERLQRQGIDPQSVTLEKQVARLESVKGARQELYNKRQAAAHKWTELEKSQKMMKQLFLDKGIDHSRRRSREHDRDMGR